VAEPYDRSPSKLESAKAVIRRFSEEIVNKGNLEVLEELVHPDVDFSTKIADLPRGIEGVRKLFSDLHRAFPDAACNIEDMLGEDDMVAERFTFVGTHKGPYRGMEPTGKLLTLQGMAMFRVVDGKIAARWGLEDTWGMMKQLGAGPA
jgi:steroid delta-isomerase-like uncharacterized protein